MVGTFHRNTFISQSWCNIAEFITKEYWDYLFIFSIIFTHCLNNLGSSLKIANITTDGDSKSFNGVNNAQGKGASQLRDIRHLSNSMKRAVHNCTFSLSMFAGKNKNNMKSRLYTSQLTFHHQVSFSKMHYLE
jgi:hypothetical protein